MIRRLEDWIDRYRFIMICSGAAVIPVFFFPLTPDDPFLVPKHLLLSFFACSLGIVLFYPFEQSPLISSKTLFLSSLFFLIAFALSIPNSTNYHEGIEELKRWIYLLIIFFSAMQIQWTPLRFRIVMVAGMVVCSVIAFSAILEYFEIVPFYRYPFTEGRLYSFFGYQNIMAQYLSIMVLWSTGLVVSSTTFKMRTLFFLSTILSGAALFLTFCRGALIAVIVSLCLFFMHFLKINRTRGTSNVRAQRPWSTIILLLFLATITVLLFYFANTQGDKIARSIVHAFHRDDSYRLTIWDDTIRMFIANPFKGVGLGNYSLVYPLYQSTDFPWLNLYAYNELLHILAETGMIGFCGFILFCFVLVRHIRRQFTSTGLSEKMLSLSILYGCVSTLMQSMVSYDLHSSASSYLFFMSLGIVCSKKLTGEEKQLIRKQGASVRFVMPCLAVLLSLWFLTNEYEKIKGHYFYSQALLSFEKNDTSKGISYSLKALQSQPNNPAYHSLIAQKYTEIGQTRSALNHFQRAHTLSPYLYSKRHY